MQAIINLNCFFALCMELSFAIIKKEDYEDVKLYFTMPHILSLIDSIAIPMQRDVYRCSSYSFNSCD